MMGAASGQTWKGAKVKARSAIEDISKKEVGSRWQHSRQEKPPSTVSRAWPLCVKGISM